MSKLLKLKEWLTVPDAARHLAIVFDEEVTEAHVLRFALDGRLRLSVYFANHAKALCGNMVPIEEAKYEEIPSPNGTGTVRLYAGPTLLSGGEASHVLELWDEVVTLADVFDLPMIGNERLDIEHNYQNLTGGPAITHGGLEGAFVEGKYGVVCQLQVDFEDNKFCRGSRAELEQLKAKIARENIEKSEAEKLLNEHKEKRAKFLKRRNSRSASENYCPASGLPEDSVLVVRTEALREFEQSIKGAPASSETPAQRRERLKKRVLEEKTKGTKAFLRTVALEEKISISRLKQIIEEVSTDSSSWGGLLSSKRQTSSKS
ncbi:hypothetical protein EBAPG3_013865 [Nitrosospira lacus]|uniref:Uncharacterized protein n=1 Tax=Nitrosospira lacus TaxID=1288494 RepID=A0A1W6SSJ4_9PROT|nr:hypothetical protein [Nitrosospira lacus]ARO88767.1 hypothetical protein EBAPG3_013865 [Nitrosospira lacus]